MSKSALQSSKNVYGEKRQIKVVVAPCCSYGHKTRCWYVSSNTSINENSQYVTIKLYRSTLQRKYKNSFLPYNSILLCSVKPKSYLPTEVSKLYLPYFPPSKQTHNVF